MDRLSAADFDWPTFPSDWVRLNSDPPARAPRVDGIKTLTTNEGVKVLDGVRVLFDARPCEVRVDATDEWVLCWVVHGKGEDCLLFSRRERVIAPIRIGATFFDARRLAAAPCWDVDERHVWLRYATHWEKRPVPTHEQFLTAAIEPLPDPGADVPGHTWEVVPGTADTTWVSELMEQREAQQLWRRFVTAGRAALLCDTALFEREPPSASDEVTLRWDLWEARATPAHAVVARREFAETAKDAALLKRLNELGAPATVHTRLGTLRQHVLELIEHPPRTKPSAVEPTPLDGLGKVRLIVSSLAPHQLPLVTRFGGFNACPFPVEQSIFFSDWQRAFGAIPHLMGPDSVQLHVERPPRGEEAVKLAWTHAIYCGENSELARGVEEALQPTWFFWWD